MLEEKNEKQRAMWGTVRALIQRMVTGVQDGYTLSLRMVGVGYRALMEEGKLSLKIGVSHPVLLEIPAGIRVSIPAPQRIILQGADWPKITQFAAQVRPSVLTLGIAAGLTPDSGMEETRALQPKGHLRGRRDHQAQGRQKAIAAFLTD